jgi:hypothetical protein
MSKLKLAAVVGVISAALVTTMASAAAQPLRLGPSVKGHIKTYLGFYDGHKDAFVVTDVSSKSQATALHVNYSAAIGTVKGAPDQYFVQGPAAKGQLSVFGSEPGESNYNPLWDEIIVTWKAGQKPVLLVRDDQIDALAKKGELTMKEAHVVLNAPITHVGGS